MSRNNIIHEYFKQETGLDHIRRDYGSRGGAEETPWREDPWLLLLREHLGSDPALSKACEFPNKVCTPHHQPNRHRSQKWQNWWWECKIYLLHTCPSAGFFPAMKYPSSGKGGQNASTMKLSNVHSIEHTLSPARPSLSPEVKSGKQWWQECKIYQRAHLSISLGWTQQRSIDMSGIVGQSAYLSRYLAYFATGQTKSEHRIKDVAMYTGNYTLQ